MTDPETCTRQLVNILDRGLSQHYERAREEPRGFGWDTLRGGALLVAVAVVVSFWWNPGGMLLVGAIAFATFFFPIAWLTHREHSSAVLTARQQVLHHLSLAYEVGLYLSTRRGPLLSVDNVPTVSTRKPDTPSHLHDEWPRLLTWDAIDAVVQQGSILQTHTHATLILPVPPATTR